MRDEPKLLNVMIADQKKQKSIYHPGPYWEEYCKRITNAIRSDGVTNFRSNHAISKGYADSVLLDPSSQWGGGSWKLRLLKNIVNIPWIKKRLIDPFYLRTIQAHYSQMEHYRQYYYDKEFGDWFSEILNRFDLPETLIGDCQEFVDIKETRISISYIKQLMRIYNFSKHIDFKKIKTVFEIGGGYAANAHLLLSLYPNIRKYLYLDIPPILYVGTQYLKHFFQQNVIDYLTSKYSRKITFKQDNEREIFAICPWQIEKTDADIDLFWNSASFQEMEKEIIQNYIDHIDRLNVDTLCLFGQRTLRTHPEIDFLSLFKKFKIKRIIPAVEQNSPPEYFIGMKY